MLDAPRPRPEWLQRRQQSYQILAISEKGVFKASIIPAQVFSPPSLWEVCFSHFLRSTYGGPQLSRQNQKPHAKTKYPWQNRKPHGKNKIPHGKTKNLTAKTNTSWQNRNLTAKTKPYGKNKIPHDKTKTLTAKPKTSRQNQILHSKNQIPHGKSKYSRQNQSYFVFAVKYLFLPWGFWFCRDVFVFAVRFLVLLWQLWATISTNLFVTKSLSENEILKSTSHMNRLHSPSNSFHYF